MTSSRWAQPRTDFPFPSAPERAPSVAARACIHELFEIQADRSPDAIALSDGLSTLSYRALDQRGNGLAQRLGALGVGVETPGGICMDLSFDVRASPRRPWRSPTGT